MAAYIVNAAPMVVDYGTQDLSAKQTTREAEQIPQHCPKFFIYGQKGPDIPQLCGGVERENIFGEATFNLRGKYANHATVFANLVNAKGNQAMYERVFPEDSKLANKVIWADVLPTTVDLYERNEEDGSIVYDNLNNPVIVGTAPGYKVKFVASYHATDADLIKFGNLPITAGDQVDSVTSEQSKRYPLFEIKAFSKGRYGSDAGFRLNAPVVSATTTMPTKMMSEERAYPFYWSMIRRENINSSPTIVETIFGDQNVMFTLKPGTIDPLTESELYIGDILLDKYQNLTDLRYPAYYGDFGSLAIYEDNIKTLLTMFHAAEKAYIDEWSDFSDSEDDIYLFNLFGGCSSSNVPYHTFQFVDSSNAIRFTSNVNHYAEGGEDGTMNDEKFAELVSAKMANYANANHSVQDLAVNVESIIYDSGFPVETKYDLCKFISIRRDTFVVLSTYVAGEARLSASEEHSLAVALRTRLQMYPESDYFGTPVMRGMIVGYSGKIRNSLYTGYLPLSAEIAVKSADYMGAGNGIWKNNKHFDGAPGSVLDYMYDVSITWVPNSVRNRNWDVGLNFVLNYNRRSLFFPALKTAYDDDTSVLNSYFTAMAICQLNKIGHAAWREFSGVSNLTNEQLVERVNAYVAKRVKGIFDDRFIIEPNCTITDSDAKRGFSWTLPIKIWSPNMKTVMGTFVQAYRKDDYETTS